MAHLKFDSSPLKSYLPKRKLDRLRTINVQGESSWFQKGYINGYSIIPYSTLPKTNIFAPENGWLEYDPFLLGRPIFRGELLVLGSVF